MVISIETTENGQVIISKDNLIVHRSKVKISKEKTHSIIEGIKHELETC